MAGRFAHQITSLMQETVNEQGLSRLYLFAPPKFLGALRRTIPERLKSHVVEREAELTQMTEAQLASHPVIVRLLRPAASTDPARE